MLRNFAIGYIYKCFWVKSHIDHEVFSSRDPKTRWVGFKIVKQQTFMEISERNLYLIFTANNYCNCLYNS